MAQIERVRWDGRSNGRTIADALVQYMTDEERRQARLISYGDLGNMMKKRHGSSFNGGTTSTGHIEGTPKGVEVTVNDLHTCFKLTWNKAAKLIHEFLGERSDDSSGDISEEDIDEISGLVSGEPDPDEGVEFTDDDAPDDDDEEVTDSAPVTGKAAGKYAEAVQCHAEILAGAEMAQQGLYRMATGFQRMRDKKLYKALGHSSFEEYCEKETGLKRSQVYNYISIVEKLPAEFVHSSGQIGVKKLSMLTTLTEEQRAEVERDVDLESTTVRELKARIDELTGAVQREKGLKEQWHKQVQKEVELSTANAERLNKEIADIQTKLDDRNEQFIQNVRELARVRKVKDEIAAEVGRLKGVIEENGIKQRSLEKELEAAKSGEAVLTDEQIEDIAGESVLVSDLRDRIEQLDIEKQAEEQRYEELQGQMNALDEAYRRENERLKEQVDRISAEKTGLETELKEASRTVTVPDTSEVEFEVKYRTALDSIRMLCKFTRAMDNDDMRERVKTLADIIRTSV